MDEGICYGNWVWQGLLFKNCSFDYNLRGSQFWSTLYPDITLILTEIQYPALIRIVFWFLYALFHIFQNYCTRPDGMHHSRVWANKHVVSYLDTRISFPMSPNLTICQVSEQYDCYLKPGYNCPCRGEGVVLRTFQEIHVCIIRLTIIFLIIIKYKWIQKSVSPVPNIIDIIDFRTK